MNKIKINNIINQYYSKKIIEYGPTPSGVDWNGTSSQMIRLEQISKVILEDTFSISDIGCGYGKYYEYLNKRKKCFKYFGYDLSTEMIKSANSLYGYYTNVLFNNINDISEIRKTDYIVSSGIFNVKLDIPDMEWLEYILDILNKINSKSIKGFAFNMLTKYSDKEYLRDNLYYGDPMFIFDYCKQKFSKNVALLHDYGLYEFTIIVRKEI